MELQLFRRGTPVRRWYWRIMSANGKKIAVGGEGFTRRGDCLKAARLALSVTWPVNALLDVERKTTRVKLT